VIYQIRGRKIESSNPRRLTPAGFKPLAKKVSPPASRAMSTRSAAAASSSKRKRRSAPAKPAEGTVKRRTKRGAGGGASAAAATVADPPTLVTVEGEWAKVMRRPREAGQFIDVTVLAGDRKIPAHKAVLVGLSPYIEGLLTSGLAESQQGGGDTLKVGDDDSTDGRAVEAIVDCFYSGELSLSQSTVSSVIRTANLFGVGAVEKAACDFFVESIEPSTACEALAFAAAHSECGEHARGLHSRCVEYVAGHFGECSVVSSFLELSSEAVAEVIGSDDLPVEEAAVLSAVRAWFDHDGAGREELLPVLLPLVRWPLLPAATQLKLPHEALLQRLMRLNDEAQILGMEMLMECTAHFAASDSAAACTRLKQRTGNFLGFTALSYLHYSTREEGALLTATAGPVDRPALCHERVMNSGWSCAEFTMVRAMDMAIGVGRPMLDVNAANAWITADFWGIRSADGTILHNAIGEEWQGMQTYRTGDVLRLLLDSDAGTLSVKKNGTLLGVAVPSGLTGDLCWAMVTLNAGDSVRIKSVDPAGF
jgi:hypothetical protein